MNKDNQKIKLGGLTSKDVIEWIKIAIAVIVGAIIIKALLGAS